MHKNNCLNTYTEKLHKFYTDNKLLAVIIILQVIILASMTFIGLFKPANNVEMPLSSLIISGNDKAVTEFSEEKILLCKTEDGDDTWVSAGGINLPFGAYKLVVDYQSEYGEFLNEKNYVASVGIYGTERVEPVYRMSGLAKETDFLFWVDSLIKDSPVSFEIIYKNNNNLQINSVSIKENIAFRFVWVMAAAIVFVITDMLLKAVVTDKSKERVFVILSVLAITFVSVIPLFGSKLHIKHDILFHLNRIWEVSESFRAGIVPARMMTGLLNGYSYPISIFYCDVFLYLPALLCCMGIALQTAYKIYITVITFVTTIVSYKAFNAVGKNKKIALLGSAVYTLCSYRLLNIYIRGALGEYTAMAFFPLVILGMYGIYTKEKITYKEWLPLAAGMSGIIMSHILSTEIVVIFLVVFCLMTLKKTFAPQRIAALIKAVAATTLASVWFIVPFLEYYITQDVNVGETFPMIQSTGLKLKEIFNVSMEAAVYENGAQVNEMTFSIGFALILCLLTALYMFAKSKKWEIHKTPECVMAIKMAVISVIALSFTHCEFPWNFIQTVSGETIGKFLGNIQFAWRYMSIASIAIVVLSVISMAEIKKQHPVAEKIISVCMVAAMIISVGYFYVDLERKDGTWDEYHYRIKDEYTRQVGLSEYMLIGSEKDDSKYLIPKIKQGEGTVEDYWKNQDKKYIVCTNNSETVSMVEIPVFNYKYYKASDVDTGEIIDISNGDANRITLNIPAKYSGTVKVEFSPPVHWHIAEAVSVVTAVAAVVWILIDKKRRNTNL